MALALTNALGSGQGRTAVRENFADIVDWANGANIGPTNMAALPGARVYNNANLTIAHNTSTALTFNSERYDTDTIHNPAVNSNRLTCNTAGVYLIHAGVTWAANANATNSVLALRLNGATSLVQDGGDAGIVGNLYQNVSCSYALVATDYVEVIVYQLTSDASARDVSAVGNASPEFGMQWISP